MFAILEELIAQDKLDITRVLGMDETKLSTVKKKSVGRVIHRIKYHVHILL
jgi:hypothetical protein